MKVDLTRLFKDCGFKPDRDALFLGAVELGHMAKQRGITDRANSLADLTATVLHCFLPKDSAVRISPNWDNPTLTQEQINYASLDVYAVSKSMKPLHVCPWDLGPQRQL